MAKRRTKKRTGRRKGTGLKTLLVVGAAAGAGYLLYKAMQKPEGEPTPEGPGGQITLQIIPAGGGVGRGIGAITPTTLQEGSTGNTAVLTVTNTSVYVGGTTPAPYTFTVFINIYGAANLNTTPPTSWTIPILVNRSQLQLGASASGTVTKTFDIPLGVYGVQALMASAQLQTTDGNTAIADSPAVKLDVIGRGVTPRGTITW